MKRQQAYKYESTDTVWLADAPVHPLQQTLKDLERAYAIFFAKQADFPLRNMTKSAAGSSETPGKNVRAKSGLNKSILDQGWFEFRRQLDYKPAWNGGQLVAAPPPNTSRSCPCCAHVSAENRQTQARLTCADTSPAVGASGQEPTEATSRGLALV